MVGVFLLATAVGTSVSETRREHAVAWVVVMAFDMTVPAYMPVSMVAMVALIVYRRNEYRTAAASH